MKVEAQGGELLLRNEHGDTIIVPRERRKEAMSALLKDDHRAIDSLALQLPKASRYAAGGTVLDGQDPPVEGIMGPETTITASRPKKSIGNFFRRWGYEHSENPTFGKSTLAGALGSGIMSLAQLPQAAVTYMLDPKGNVLPSKALQGTQTQKDIEMSAAQGNIGAKIFKHPIVQDMVLDPLLLSNEIAKGVSKGSELINGLKKSELINDLGNKYLPNAYKLNPKAITHESFNNPNSFYRQIDTPTFNEGLESGLIKGKQGVDKTQGENIINLNKSFGDDAYYFKGKLYSPQRADYIYEVNKGEEFFRPRVNNKDYLKKGIPYTVENTNVRVSRTPIPIEEATIYKKDWLQGYKQVEVPKTTQNFKSEINWGQWNKEIPENTQLMKEYNAIDYRKNPLSDKEKEMYQWFDEQMRFDKLPETTNKQSIEVLDNFKQRIKTPEGQKRLKELGITEEQLLQDLKIVEDPNTYGYYRGLNKNTIAINPNHPLPKKVVRHEIEHGVQNALRKSKINKAIDGTPAEKLKALEINTTEIDDILSELTLRREGTPNKVWNKINTNETVNINDYKSLINNKQNATDYFLTGSDGAEKSAFLGEVQQYMMDAGKIPKNSYVQITPEMVKETMVDAMFDEKTGGKYLRLFNIIKADPKNYEIISKGLNKMLSITPLIGAGAYMQNKEYKNGGAIGNNGMFDMTNPNIYKGLSPTIIAGALANKKTKK